MTTQSINENEPTDDAVNAANAEELLVTPAPNSVRRSLIIYRRCLVGTVIGVIALTILVLYCWRLIDEAGARTEQRIVQSLAPQGASANYWEGHVGQLTFTGGGFRSQTVSELSSFPHLNRLVFIDTSLSNQDLAEVAKLKSLHELVIIQAPITDEGLAHLASAQNLTYLRLSQTEITGDGLEHLSHLSQLRRLDLEKSHIGDESLKFLQRLTELEKLYLTDTDVSDDGVRDLQIALPKAIIKLEHAR